MVDITLGERLRLLREKKDWTQKQAANIFGITNGALSNYERNKRTPDVHTLKKFAEVYNTSIDYLLGNTNINPNSPRIDENYNYTGIENIIGFDCLRLLYEIGELDEDEQELMALLLEGIKARKCITKNKKIEKR